MKDKKKIFNVLFWVNILIVIFIVGLYYLGYKYNHTCLFSVKDIEELHPECGTDSWLLLYRDNYSFINNIFYISIFISIALTVVLIIWNIVIKNIKKVIVLLLILISFIGVCIYNYQKAQNKYWTSITSDRN